MPYNMQSLGKLTQDSGGGGVYANRLTNARGFMSAISIHTGTGEAALGVLTFGVCRTVVGPSGTLIDIFSRQTV